MQLRQSHEGAPIQDNRCSTDGDVELSVLGMTQRPCSGQQVFRTQTRKDQMSVSRLLEQRFGALEIGTRDGGEKSMAITTWHGMVHGVLVQWRTGRRANSDDLRG